MQDELSAQWEYKENDDGTVSLSRSRYGACNVANNQQLTQLAYFMDEGTWDAIGYDGPWLGRIDVTVASPPALGRVEELQ